MQAFERLYMTHVSRIHSLARRMAGAQQADELTQDVFVRAWQRLGSFRGESAFGTWLYRLAVNVIVERFRSRRSERGRFLDSELAMSLATSKPESHVERLGLERALTQLPDGARKIFVLHDVEGYKHDEIAQLLDIASGTSKAQLHRARILMRGHLDRPRPARGE